MNDTIQIRDLTPKLEACGDQSQYIGVCTDEGDKSQELPILDVVKGAGRQWWIMVPKPEPDEEALEELQIEHEGIGYQKAKNEALELLKTAKSFDDIADVILGISEMEL